MRTEPRLIQPVLLGILAVVLVVAAVYYLAARPDNTTAVGLLAGCGAVFLGASIATGINWIAFQWWQRDIEKRRAQAVTPMLELVHAVSRLNSDQIGVVGLNNYRAIVELAGAESGPIYMLRTAGGAVPMEFVERTLLQATPLGLPPVRQYSDGSPEREWLRLLTQWAVDMHLAIPATGPYSAQWIERGGRYKAASVLGIALRNADYEAVTE